jgi:hypothetical protein
MSSFTMDDSKGPAMKFAPKRQQPVQQTEHTDAA